MSLVNSFFILLLFQNFKLIKNEYKNNPNCFLYVPEGYNSLQTPDPVTTVDFEHEITNFDSIKVQDYVSEKIITNNWSLITPKTLKCFCSIIVLTMTL